MRLEGAPTYDHTVNRHARRNHCCSSQARTRCDFLPIVGKGKTMTDKELQELNEELNSAQWVTPKLDTQAFSQALELNDIDAQLNEADYIVGNMFTIAELHA